MAQLPSWTREVSDRLIDIQCAAERGDQRLIALIHETQAYLSAAEQEIVGYCTTIRTGKMPRRMLQVIENSEQQAA